MTETIVGRVVEAASLREAIAGSVRGEPQLVVLFGRRRVGKTFLLRHVLDSAAVPSLYFAALRGRSSEEAERLSAEIERRYGERPAADWSSVFLCLVGLARTQTVVVAIDEAPYLADEDRAWASALQHAWDEAQRGGPCYLFLCLTGSAVTTMLSIVSSGGPLFGRTTLRIRLDPFDLPMAHEYLGRPVDPRRTMEAFAACGGYPLFLRQWDLRATAATNLKRLAAAPHAPLAVDANVFLLDLPDPTGFRRALTAIGRRKKHYRVRGDIIEEFSEPGGDNPVGLKRSDVNQELGQRADRALAVLEQIRLIQRVHPIGDRSPKAFVYRIADHYLAFWFMFVEPHLQDIESGAGAQVISRTQRQWETYLGVVFEEEARAHARRLVGRGELPAGTVGQWWEGSSDARSAEIDVVIDSDGWLLVGEAKMARRFGRNEWEKFNGHLRNAGDRTRHAQRALWLAGELDPTIRSQAPDLRVYGLDDMVQSTEA